MTLNQTGAPTLDHDPTITWSRSPVMHMTIKILS